MTTANTVLHRLRDGALRDLVVLVIDDLLTRPVEGLLDPDFVADQVIKALETASEGEQTERWLRQRIADLLDRVPEGRLGDHAIPEIVDPLREALGQPIVWDRELVRRLVDHPALRELFSDVVRRAVTSYAEKLAHLSRDNPVSQTASRLGIGGRSRGLGGGLGRLKSLGEGIAKGLSAELEAQAEARARDFVAQAMTAVMQQVADHLTDPAYADHYGRYRVHIVDTLLDTDLQVLAGEIHKMDPDRLVATGAAVARALARREGFHDELARAIRTALHEAGGRSLRDFLVQAGIDETRWRADIEDQVVARGMDLLQTDEFRAWLDGVLR